jgi:predicted hydrocarbon binding protein
MDGSRAVENGIEGQKSVRRLGRYLPAKLSWQLLMALQEEIGEPMLKATVRQAGICSLSELASRRDSGVGMSSEEYARLLAEVRSYYGHGARGALTRVGRTAWNEQVKMLGIGIRSKVFLGRVLLRKRAAHLALGVLAGQLCGKSAQIAVYSGDTEYYLVDSISDATYGQTTEEPVCAVTVGLIQGALSWGTGEEFEVEEIACMAAGAESCKFRIRP